MRVQITNDSTATETWIEIHTNQTTEKISMLADEIGKIRINENNAGNEKSSVIFSAWDGDIVKILKPEVIIRFYSMDKKVYVQTNDGIFLIKRYLYEIENMLYENNLSNFFRISNSEIVNFDFIENFDMSISGTIHINFKNGEHSVVSRRYTKIIYKKLQIHRGNYE